MNKIIKIGVLLLLTSFISSCDKEDEEEDKFSKTSLLTASTWKIYNYTSSVPEDYDFDGDSSTNIWEQMDTCEKDDKITFSKNFTYTFDNGPINCDSTSPQILTQNWKFNSDESVITLNDSEVFDIVELNQNNLILRLNFPQYFHLIYFKH